MVTITVADIIAPGAGKKQGRIVDSTGKQWNVWGDKLHLYQRGMSYAITFKQNTFNGKTFDVIEAVNPAPQPTQATSAAAIPRPSTEDPQRSEDIAVLAIVKEWVGHIPVGDTDVLVHALRTARAAWRISKQPDDGSV